MTEIDFLIEDGGPTAPTFLFSHGAGATMDAPFMTSIAQGLARRGIRVARFDFAYMAARRVGGPKRPPPKVEVLQEEFHKVIKVLASDGPLVIGGKSMGGRIASLVADDLFANRHVSGLLCLGYPFHPQGKPEKQRTAHLSQLQTPTLICQGTRDPFGTREDVAGYTLSEQIKLSWVEDGDHDLKPRKRVTGVDHATQLEQVCELAAAWLTERL
ncbi:Alpha/beta hydrolase family protein [Shimia sp. SK013]|uniref:alpha/beta family hydrolase n=1 Tax=Shimia sp. SK013 TaxID=1389006 RepID=UPI0006B4B6FE|nr:alpha/beta family hydrolase [Shimia sp. SK013]KPA21400.1 Alpha/beta hydrolase family protein [Shimia sp. SK013]